MNITERPLGDPNAYDEKTCYQELIRVCDTTHDTPYGLIYFINNYCHILDNDSRQWIPFKLWVTDAGEFDNQIDLAQKIIDNKRLVILKARQLGMTWLVICSFLWEMLFFPIVRTLLVSKGEMEGIEILGRMRGVYKHLPMWMRTKGSPTNSRTVWRLSNGSTASVASTRQGDSLTATHVLVDEADLLRLSRVDLRDVLLRVEPTVGNEGRLILLSKSDKDIPDSTFKNIFTAAMKGESQYTPAFLPYYIRPGRDDEWYAAQEEDARSIDGTLDAIHENYPRTPEEALAPRSFNKRFSLAQLKTIYQETSPIYISGVSSLDTTVPDVPGLVVYEKPISNESYLLVMDPAEGLTRSDPSAIMILKISDLSEVGHLSDTFEIGVFCSHANKIGEYYNNAWVIWERNNHGHAVKLWFQSNPGLRSLEGWDRSRDAAVKLGWLSNALGKALAYDELAKCTDLTQTDGTCLIRGRDTYNQLLVIERATLRAPNRKHDDLAITFAIGVAAIRIGCIRTFSMDFIRIK